MQVTGQMHLPKGTSNKYRFWFAQPISDSTQRNKKKKQGKLTDVSPSDFIIFFFLKQEGQDVSRLKPTNAITQRLKINKTNQTKSYECSMGSKGGFLRKTEKWIYEISEERLKYRFLVKTIQPSDKNQVKEPCLGACWMFYTIRRVQCHPNSLSRRINWGWREVRG